MKSRQVKSLSNARAPAPSWSKLFRQQVGIRRNPRAALQALRADLTPEKVQPFFAELRRNAMFMATIAPNRTPRRFVDLGAGPRMRARGLALDLAWAAEVMASFPDIIGSFLEHEAAYEAAYGDVRLRPAEGLP